MSAEHSKTGNQESPRNRGGSDGNGRRHGPVDAPILTTDHETLTIELRLVPSPKSILRGSNPAIYFREPLYGSLRMMLLRNARVWLTVAKSDHVDDVEI